MATVMPRETNEEIIEAASSRSLFEAKNSMQIVVDDNTEDRKALRKN